MAQPLLVLLARTVMVCAIWQEMSLSGQAIPITVTVTFFAAAAGTPSTTTVPSRAGTSTARTTWTTSTGFGCVVECFSLWIFRNPMFFFLLPF